MHKFIRGWRSGMRYYVPELDMWVSSCTLTRVLATKLNMTPQQYYDKHLLANTQDKFCCICGKPAKFTNIAAGYRRTCDSIECKRRRRSILSTNMHANAEFKQRFKQTLKCAQNKDTTRQKRKTSLAAYWSVPEHRKAQSERSKQLHANGKYDNKNKHGFGNEQFVEVDLSLNFSNNIRYINDKPCMFVASNIEHLAAQAFERLHLRYAREYVKIPYIEYDVAHTYKVDFLVVYNNVNVLVEIKQTFALNDKEYTKMLIAQQYVAEHSNEYSHYSILTKDMLLDDAQIMYALKYTTCANAIRV